MKTAISTCGPHYLSRRSQTRSRKSKSYEGYHRRKRKKMCVGSSIQYSAKFLPRLAEVEAPLRELTRKDVLFYWDKPQVAAFQKLKDMCCEAPVLAYYDVSKDVTIQCDASKSAVGAVLLQEGRPIAYASRKFRASELNWAPIEKEMLAIVFSTQTFREYILGKETLVQTDHKLLEMILRKPMATALLRLQAMMLKLSGYDLKVEYLPGKKQVQGDWVEQDVSARRVTVAA